MVQFPGHRYIWNMEFPCGFLLMRDIGWLRHRRAKERPGEPSYKRIPIDDINKHGTIKKKLSTF